jgi:hypothetical protein
MKSSRDILPYDTSSWELPHPWKKSFGASKIPKPFVAMDQSIKPYPPKMIKTLKWLKL